MESGVGRGSRGAAGAGCVAWLALLLALAALLLAWSAYRRSGGRMNDWMQRPGEAVQDALGRPLDGARDALGHGRRETERQAALARAGAALAEQRGELEARRDLGAVRARVEAVRDDLARAFADAGATARARWRALDADLERLDAQLHEGSSRALATLDGLVERIRGALGSR
jgi:hypothetical protein